MHSVVLSMVNTNEDEVFNELRNKGVSDYVIPYEGDKKEVIEDVFRLFRGKVEETEEGWLVTITVQNIWQYNRDKLEEVRNRINEKLEEIECFSIMDIYRLRGSIRDELDPWILDDCEQIEVCDTYLTAYALYARRNGSDIVQFVVKEVYDFHE